LPAGSITFAVLGLDRRSRRFEGRPEQLHDAPLAPRQIEVAEHGLKGRAPAVTGDAPVLGRMAFYVAASAGDLFFVSQEVWLHLRPKDLLSLGGHPLHGSAVQ